MCMGGGCGGGTEDAPVSVLEIPALVGVDVTLRGDPRWDCRWALVPRLDGSWAMAEGSGGGGVPHRPQIVRSGVLCCL